MLNTHWDYSGTMIIANMLAAASKPWMPRVAAFCVAALLAASGVFWVLRWPASMGADALPLPQTSEELPPASVATVARLLGAEATATEVAVAPDAASRFRLTGIIASGSGSGVALLSIDGQPSKPFRVGSQLASGWMLQSVQQRRVALATDANAPVGLQLELPERP
jgi:general secretion pathway protein C